MARLKSNETVNTVTAFVTLETVQIEGEPYAHFKAPQRVFYGIAPSVSTPQSTFVASFPSDDDDVIF